ncbi:hypothetical protein LA080_001397 [Diaporthe eres]|uniref:Uncharacterized protein n=1 Tax=Diaporthe vaccinii TaxID=105482 RepID=A0ABR4EUF4_9PEZI|nr:hypothetical protein LA080_001397 [Diaporthe eres]
MKLPNELMSKIIREIIDTPAVFVFDVVTGTLQHSPTGPDTDYRYMSFQPRVNPPGNHTRREYPGSFESQGIKVPTTNGQAIVHFNPRKHVICLDRIDHSAFLTHRGFMLGPQDLINFARQLTDLDFDIDHLGFMAERACCDHKKLDLFKAAFPTIRHFYAVVTELPRKDPWQPVDFICPARDPAHTLSPILLHTAKRSWNVVKATYFFNGRSMSIRGDWEQGYDIEGMVLI